MKFLGLSGIAVLGEMSVTGCMANLDNSDRDMNIVLFTADDLGCISVGCYGSTLNVTPNIDRFASSGITFDNGYVNASISSPSRKIIMTGLFGHNSGAMGFKPIDTTRCNVPILADILRENGYRTGILGKVQHSSPFDGYKWDYQHDYEDLGRGRNPELYAGYTSEFLKQCREEGKPFYFMVNSHDPHRPFHNPDDPNALNSNAKIPSKLFSPEEVEVPDFLPDTYEIREELSWYYNSTRRLDDTFGAVMKVLEEDGVMNNTLIVFLSDNGISLPFAKANVYYASNRVPFIIRYPRSPNNGKRNHEDFVQEVDLLLTFLDLLGIKCPENIDGTSFKKVLKGKWGTHRNYSFNQIDRKASGPSVPMRSIITENWCYIFNAWPDGERRYFNNNEGKTMKSMDKLAKTDEFIASRVRMYRYRTEEEFYDMRQDKASLRNLIDEASLQDTIKKFRQMMDREMVAHSDTLLPAFRARDDFWLKERELKKAYPSMFKDR